MLGHAAKVKRLGRVLAVAGILGLMPNGVMAEVTQPPVASVPILVVDQERLFSRSAFGQASLAREQAAARALEAENNRIQAELVAEEQQLTLLRKTLAPEEFTLRAEEFDRKVEKIRAEQDAKARAFSRKREEDGKAFFDAILPVLADIMADQGALVILNKSDVIVSLNVIDVTDEAVVRVDRLLGDPAATQP